MPQQRTTLRMNNPPMHSHFSAYREGLLMQMQGRDAVAAAVAAPPTHNQRSSIRWGYSVGNNNSYGSSRGDTGCIGSMEDVPLREEVMTPISVGSRAENAPFASSSPHSSTPAVARGPGISAGTMGGLMPSPSLTSFQQHFKHPPSLSSRFDSMHGVSRRPPGFAAPYSLDALPQPQREDKAGTRSNGAYTTFLAYGGTAAPSYHVDPNLHGFFPQSRQVPQTTGTAVVSASDVLHTALFSAERGPPAPHHSAGIQRPPPPLPQQDQPEQQTRSYTREAVGEAFETAMNPPLQRLQHHHDPVFWELFERLAYRPSSRHRRGAAATRPQRRSEQSRVGGDPSIGGWMRRSPRLAQITPSIIPSYSPFRPRPGSPPPLSTLSREVHNSRTTLRFASTRRASRLSDGYLFEAAFAPDVDNMSYEELLDLAESIGRVERGVPRERLLQLRVLLQPIHFGVMTERTGGALSPREEECLTCCVCLDSFSVGHVATQLPCCRHFLHEGCASRWFESHFRCPICTRDVRDT
ncbi:Zinc finger (ISS) [Trypanosoma conorhini]|uniref:Zinc finger (ISS) n=1 Tax=Trypanosoma conorhini TaxID=83891 RepID=A0A422NHJ4_9TRYP|nr:Zinc finger (ISS) [Trypanosoma conorhini]RNF04935.1 Zinc finger (ISS) [Trypanosoma conorhini]